MLMIRKINICDYEEIDHGKIHFNETFHLVSLRITYFI